jgi:heme A synthase
MRKGDGEGGIRISFTGHIPHLCWRCLLFLGIQELLGMWMASLYLLFSLTTTRIMGLSALGALLAKFAGKVVYNQLCVGNSCD